MGHADRLRDCGEGRPDCAGALLQRVLLRGDQVLEGVAILQDINGLAPHFADLAPGKED